jgi:hypothetical protein
MVKHFSWTAWSLKMWPIIYPETSATDYKSTPRNISGEWRSHLHRGGTLISRPVLRPTETFTYTSGHIALECLKHSRFLLWWSRTLATFRICISLLLIRRVYTASNNWKNGILHSKHVERCVCGLRSRSVVFKLFCSRTPRYNFSSTLYP